MKPNREEALFGLALTKAATERVAWLDRECGDNQVLRQRLNALPAAHEQTTGVLADGPAPLGVPSSGRPVPRSRVDNPA